MRKTGRGSKQIAYECTGRKIDKKQNKVVQSRKINIGTGREKKKGARIKTKTKEKGEKLKKRKYKQEKN